MTKHTQTSAQFAKRSEVLDELVIHAQNVELQDSLQHLASLPEPERMKIIQQIIDDLIAAEKRAEEEAKNARLIWQNSKEISLNSGIMVELNSQRYRT
ncbi:MAG: hypothetical protein V8R52_11245 [Coprobacter fastidiosus]